MLFPSYSDTTSVLHQRVEIQDTKLREMLVRREVGPVLTSNEDFKLVGLVNVDYDIFPFEEPLYSRRDKTYIVDMRSFVTSVSTPQHYTVNAQRDFQSRTVFGTLHALWDQKHYHLFREDFKGAGEYFVMFLTNVISLQYSLSPLEKANLSALVSLYWCQLCDPDWYSYDENTKSAKAVKFTTTPKNEIEVILSKNIIYGNIQELGESMVKAVDSVKLKDMDALGLYNITANKTFGYNMEEFLGASLEYPPAWVTIMYSSLTDKSFRNSFIARLAKRDDGVLSRNVSKFIAIK